MGSEINTLTIDGLKLTPLKQFLDERGGVFHYLKSDAETFKGFGEAYFSKINPGVVKGWKFHKEMYQHFCVPLGVVKIVLYDARENSPSYGEINEVILNDSDKYALLSMPPHIWYSFKCDAESYSLLANITNINHDPSESITLDINSTEIPYGW